MEVEQRQVGPLSVFEASNPKALGTVVLFHGFGADAKDLLPLASLYPDFSWIFPNGPLEVAIAPGYSGKAWFEVDIELLQQAMLQGRHEEIKQAFPQELTGIHSLGKEFIAELDIPAAKLCIGGFSQGAVLATDIALNAPYNLGALLILSGTLVNQTRWGKLASLHAGMPFFQSHGALDPLLPIDLAKDLEKLLQQGGLKGKLHPFEGGHEIPQSTCQELSRFLDHLVSGR